MKSNIDEESEGKTDTLALIFNNSPSLSHVTASKLSSHPERLEKRYAFVPA